MNSIENLMSETLSKMKSMIDITTIVGTPITLENNTVIIPISKAAIGLVVGGGDIDNKTRGAYPFAGGTGAGINLTPSGFLVFSNDKWEFCSTGSSTNYAEILGLAGNILKSLKGENNND